jgi:hypothetical protein
MKICQDEECPNYDELEDNACNTFKQVSECPTPDYLTTDSAPGPCGCDKPVRYMVGDNEYACNKYMRCLTYEEMRDALALANTGILKLRTAIERHRDNFPDEAMEGEKDLWNILDS